MKLERGIFTDAEQTEIEAIRQNYQELLRQLHSRVIDLDEIIEQLLICALSGGHTLIIGVPGLAKTLLMRSLAELLELKFSRIQFTPDLMPSDITGTEILVKDESEGSRYFKFLQGPIFANIILADEINRTPPKTQSALLEAMEEHSVTSMGHRFTLESPFFVLATQNPIEQEGTYPLPVAQLDRFMFNILVDYPSSAVEYTIMRRTIGLSQSQLTPVFSREKLLHIAELVRRVEVSPSVLQYALSLCRMSRPHVLQAPRIVKDYLSWGASPRAAQCLIIGGKARAILNGNDHVVPEDIRSIFYPVMRHRILPNYRAEADMIAPDEILSQLLEAVPAPDGAVKKRKTARYSRAVHRAEAVRAMPEEKSTTAKYPRAVRLAAMIWIVVGRLILIAVGISVLSLPFVVMLISGRDRVVVLVAIGFSAAINIPLGAIFVHIGKRTVRGTAKDTLGSAIGSIIYGMLMLSGASSAMSRPATVKWIIVGICLLVGLAMLIAGVLALVGREKYIVWRPQRSE